MREAIDYVFRHLPVATNYFWQAYLRRHYTPQCCPRYLTRTGFDALKGGLAARVRPHTCTVTDFLAGTRERISRFVLLDHMDWMSSYHPQALAGGMAAHPGTRHARRPRAASQRSCQTALDRIRLACADGAAPLRQVLRFHNEWARELTRQDRVHTYAGFHIADLPG